MFTFMSGYVLGQRSAAQAAAFSRSAGAADGLSSMMKDNELDERIDRLLLLVEAMWSLMREQGFSDEDLMAKLVELDEADGVADGRRTRQPSVCRKCGSKVAASLSACQFCGQALTSEPGPFAGA